MGTVSTLSPVRTTGSLRGFLGGLARAITPVRRSARKRTPGKPLEAMLEETGYSYGGCRQVARVDGWLEKAGILRLGDWAH